LRQGARNLDSLAIGHRELADLGVDIQFRTVERVEEFARPFSHGWPVEGTPFGFGGLPEEDVFSDRQLGKEQQFLMDRGDAGCMGISRRREFDLPAFHRNLAFVGLVETGHNLDQRRFAGAILAKERMHLACAHIEAYILQDLEPGKRLGDMRKGNCRWPFAVPHYCTLLMPAR
jgi:hypothetical protein